MATDITPLLPSQNNTGHHEQKLFSIVNEFGQESKRLWKLAGPAIRTTICQNSLVALTQTFAGLVNEVDLAAVSVENYVIAGLGFGVMLGMGSVLETLCGQAYDATRDHLPYLFTNSKAVAEETRKPGILPGVTVLVNSLQPALSDGEGQLQTTDLNASSNFTRLTPGIVALAQTNDGQETPSAMT
ncbi:protein DETOXIFICATION 33-like [Populus alba x Populus x berolinensis]|uniref:Protein DETOXIFICATION 33-like n=1 Tax=Populus alba x Populus x berolinensis TaxID=444605 RepID=A0AAD6WC33_9ROSI|nr:protein DETOXIFICATION 33-like [Populus alba x Populus x berolinensis]